MKFEKGKPKTGGRTKGTPNAITSDLREYVKTTLENNQQEFINRMEALDNEGFCRIYLKLMEFNLPKLREVAGTVNKEPVYYKLPDGTVFEW